MVPRRLAQWDGEEKRARQAGDEVLVNSEDLPRLSRPYGVLGGVGRARQAGDGVLVNGEDLPRLSRPYDGFLIKQGNL